MTKLQMFLHLILRVKMCSLGLSPRRLGSDNVSYVAHSKICRLVIEMGSSAER